MMPGHAFGFGFSAMFTIVPLFIGVVFILVIGSILANLGKGMAEWSDNINQPEATVDATVVSKRVQVSGGENSTSTRYFATFELPGGERCEFKMNGSEYGQLAEADTGQLRHQGSRYLGFHRVPTSERPPTAPPNPAAANLVCDYCRSAIPDGSIKCSNCGWTWHPASHDRALT